MSDQFWIEKYKDGEFTTHCISDARDAIDLRIEENAALGIDEVTTVKAIMALLIERVAINNADLLTLTGLTGYDIQRY